MSDLESGLEGGGETTREDRFVWGEPMVSEIERALDRLPGRLLWSPREVQRAREVLGGIAWQAVLTAEKEGV